MFTNLQMMSVVQPELQPGETVLWTHRPDARGEALRSIWTVFFGLPFIGAYFVLSISFPDHSDFWSIDLLLLLIGFLGFTGPWGTYSAARHTVYAITDRRVLIVREFKSRLFKFGNGKSVKTYNEAAFDHIRVVERANCAGGHVVFYEQHPTQGRAVHFRLANIPEVRSVANLLHTTFPHCN